MSSLRIRFLLFVLVAGTTLLWAKDFWESKDFLKWSEKECAGLMTKSPWAYPYALTNLLIPAPANLGGGGGSASRYGTRIGGDFGAGDREVHLVLQMRFLAARPVRAAIGRMRLIQNPASSELPRQVEEYVNQEDPAQIVVELTWSSQPSGHPALRTVEAAFRDDNLDQLRSRCFLSSSETGKYVAISEYTGPAQGYPGALLTFPRFDEQGNPHFTGAEKTLMLRLENRLGTIEQTFNPRKMLWQGKFSL